MSAPAWHQPLPRMAAWIPREGIEPLRWTRRGLKPNPTLLVSRCVAGWQHPKGEADLTPPKRVCGRMPWVPESPRRLECCPETARPSPTWENTIEPFSPLGNKYFRENELSGPSLPAGALGHWEATGWVHGA